MISLICEVLNHLSGKNPSGMAPVIAFSPFLLVLIPLSTIDRSYWDRIKGKWMLASFMLLDFKNNPTTAIAFISAFILFGLLGYMVRYCIFIY